MITKKIHLFLLLIILSRLLVAQTETGSDYIIVTAKKLGIKPSNIEIPNYVENFGTPIEARFVVLSSIKGQLLEDTIKCISFTSIYSPGLKSEFALLYLLKSNDHLFLWKRTDLFKTKIGKLAGVYALEDYMHPNNLNSVISPIKLDFNESVEFDLKVYRKKAIPKLFPTPFFRVTKSKAIPLYGNYPNELYLLKENGIIREKKTKQIKEENR